MMEAQALHRIIGIEESKSDVRGIDFGSEGGGTWEKVIGERLGILNLDFDQLSMIHWLALPSTTKGNRCRFPSEYGERL
jgi:hypothetical protein